MKKITVTVGMTALNEENNIINIIESILLQKSTNHVLKQLLIVSDGSQDNTVRYAKSVKSNKIRVINFSKRGGMTKRLNVLFKLFKTDVFIKIDADLLPVNNNLINEMCAPFINDPKVGLVGGKLIAKSTKNIVEKIVNAGRFAWDGIKKEHLNGDSFYSLPGGIYAISKNFTKYAVFPSNIWSDVGYIYYSCTKNGFKFKSNKKALVYLNLPSTIGDYVKQISRYDSQIEPLVKLFGDDVKKQYVIPNKILLKYKLLAFLKYPFECGVLAIINFYVKFISSYKELNSNYSWQIAKTSKFKI